ncbi:hypothetical protein [Sphingomonas paucimobilis]|uniref:hypothetical protein n=1 Tax=Sphingomonas paucimobilis TaxID=13689 RepID=UPI0020403D07|nr:hypothetical protein [Sphingomonas paucimobilis]MCM3679495.1 hypothetical protein [Sphingomonas paucimobilis]
MKTISRDEFEALRPMNDDLVAIERDTEFWYETFLNEDGDEIAFASHHSHRETIYQLRDAQDGGEDA